MLSVTQKVTSMLLCYRQHCVGVMGLESFARNPHRQLHHATCEATLLSPAKREVHAPDTVHLLPLGLVQLVHKRHLAVAVLIHHGAAVVALRCKGCPQHKPHSNDLATTA